MSEGDYEANYSHQIKSNTPSVTTDQKVRVVVTVDSVGFKIQLILLIKKMSKNQQYEHFRIILKKLKIKVPAF